MTPTVITRKDGRMARITLNTSRYTFDTGGLEQIETALLNWASDATVELVLLDHSEGCRGFCFGIDAAFLSDAGRCEHHVASDYLASLYQVCNLIAEFPKPFITIMDGVVRGSGAGLALNSAYQVATNRTVMSFPETGFGFVPDSGASWYLARLPNEVGTWLALSGSKLIGADVVASGLGTHYCESAAIPVLMKALREHGVAALIEYTNCPEFSMNEHEDEIRELFAGDCAILIKKRLENGSDWAKKIATKIDTKSPLSTKIALKQLRFATYLDSVKQALKIEYRLATRLSSTRNFREGVRAMFVDMDYCPEWKPDALKNVTFDMVSEFFTPLYTFELQFNSATAATLKKFTEAA